MSWAETSLEADEERVSEAGDVVSKDVESERVFFKDFSCKHHSPVLIFVEAEGSDVVRRTTAGAVEPWDC